MKLIRFLVHDVIQLVHWHDPFATAGKVGSQNLIYSVGDPVGVQYVVFLKNLDQPFKVNQQSQVMQEGHQTLPGSRVQVFADLQETILRYVPFLCGFFFHLVLNGVLLFVYLCTEQFRFRDLCFQLSDQGLHVFARIARYFKEGLDLREVFT